LKSSVKFLQSVMIWGAMSSAGVGPLRFQNSTVNAAIYQEILEHFMLPSVNKLYGNADLIFQQDLAPAHQNVVQWPWCYCAWLTSKLVWGRWETPDPTIQMTWRLLSKQPGLILHLSSATGWTPPYHAALIIHAKGGPTKYWVHRNEHTFQKPDIPV